MKSLTCHVILLGLVENSAANIMDKDESWERTKKYVMRLVVNGLSYARNKKLLFKRLTFQVSSGEALHILGPNGAGKTSLLQVLIGLIPALSGKVLYNGMATRHSPDFKKNLLYISHRQGMKHILTPFENLYLFLLQRGFSAPYQSLQQMKRTIEGTICQVLQKLDLAAYCKTLTASLSAGQRQRLQLAKLLLVKADCWVLDEPFTALDKAGIQFISLLIEEQLSHGGMVIFTSHQPLSLASGKLQQLFLGS
jgi:heme exporter protein A